MYSKINIMTKTLIKYNTYDKIEDLMRVCENLTITTIEKSAFEDSSLTKIKLSSSVTTIGDYAFAGCKSLTEIKIPEGVTRIGKGAFSIV